MSEANNMTKPSCAKTNKTPCPCSSRLRVLNIFQAADTLNWMTPATPNWKTPLTPPPVQTGRMVTISLGCEVWWWLLAVASVACCFCWFGGTGVRWVGMLTFLALGGCYVTDGVGGWPIEWQVAWYQNIYIFWERQRQAWNYQAACATVAWLLSHPCLSRLSAKRLSSSSKKSVDVVQFCSLQECEQNHLTYLTKIPRFVDSSQLIWLVC